MDGSRKRRIKDAVRKVWYAHQRQLRFARLLGFSRVEGKAQAQCVVDPNAQAPSLESGCNVLTSPSVSNLRFGIEEFQSNPSPYPKERS
jgi:hypothetical protein